MLTPLQAPSRRVREERVWHVVAFRQKAGEVPPVANYCIHFAGNRAIRIRVLETSVASSTGVSHALGRTRLWSLVEEDNPSAVDDVCLNIRAVKKALDVLQTNHIVVHVSPDLKNTMVVMIWNTMLTDASIAVHAENISLVLLQRTMLRARDEEFLR